MKIVYKGASAEITEKKSRFIATVAPVNSEEEASAFIAKMKKQYWDCRHNCSAFVIGDEGRITRCSDDGEPSGTAGRPILDVITGLGVTNVCVVVSRYFGGTLLGTGGLVRAYSAAAREGLLACELAENKKGRELKVMVSYDLEGKIRHLAGDLGLNEKDSIYEENVSLTYIVPEESFASFEKKINDATAGKAQIEISDPIFFLSFPS